MHKTLLAIGMVLSIGSMERADADPPAANKDWGALAFSSPKAIHFGWAVDFSSKEKAEAAAVKACNEKEAKFTKGKRTCRVHEWFHGACGALAIHPNADGNIDLFGWAQAPTRDGAEKAALDECRKAGGKACRIEVAACNK
jgi:hypothetical protein